MIYLNCPGREAEEKMIKKLGLEEEQQECKKKLKELSNYIEDNNELIFSEIYGDRVYYIYLNKGFT